MISKLSKARAMTALWSSSRLLSETQRDFSGLAEELELRLMSDPGSFRTSELVQAMELLRPRGSVVTRAAAKQFLGPGGARVAGNELITVGRHLSDADFQKLVIDSVDLSVLDEPSLLTLVFEASSRGLKFKDEQAALEAVVGDPKKFSASGIAKLLESYPPSQHDFDVLLPRILKDFASLRPESALVLLNLLRTFNAADKTEVVELIASDVAAGVVDFRADQLLVAFRCGVEFQIWPLLAEVTPRLASVLEDLSTSELIDVFKTLKVAKMTALIPDLLPSVPQAKLRQFSSSEALELLRVTQGHWATETLEALTEPLTKLSAVQKLEAMQLLAVDGLGEKNKKVFEALAAGFPLKEIPVRAAVELLELLSVKNVGGRLRRRIFTALQSRQSEMAVEDRIAVLFLCRPQDGASAAVEISGFKPEIATLQRLMALVVRGQAVVNPEEFEEAIRAVMAGPRTPSPAFLTSALATGVSDEVLAAEISEKLVAMRDCMAPKSLLRAFLVLGERSEISSAKTLWTSLAKNLRDLSVENLLVCVRATQKLGLQLDEAAFKAVVEKCGEGGEAAEETLAEHVETLQRCGVWEELEPRLQRKLWQRVQSPEGLRPPDWKQDERRARQKRPGRATQNLYNNNAGKEEPPKIDEIASRQFIDLVKKM